MNKIVRERYPVEKLPLDLREGVDPKTYVRITIEQEQIEDDLPSMVDLIGSAPGVYASPEEGVAFIRALRDEWER